MEIQVGTGKHTCSSNFAKLSCAACEQRITYLLPLLPGSQPTAFSSVPSISWLSRGMRLSGDRGSSVSRARSLQRSMCVISLAEDELAEVGRLTPTMTTACSEACAY